MSFVKSLNFQSAVVSSGDVLDFVSTTDVTIPEGSEVALKALKYIPGVQNFTSGRLNLTLRRNGVTIPLMQTLLEKFVPQNDQGSLDLFLIRLNDEFKRQMAVNLKRDRIPFGPFIGCQIAGFSGPNVTIEFNSQQFVSFGVVDAIDQQTIANPELITQAIEPNIINGGSVNLSLDVSGNATQDGYMFGGNPLTQFGYVRMRPGAQPSEITNGFVTVSVSTIPRTDVNDPLLIELKHFYFAANGNQNGIRPGSPGVQISINGRVVLIEPTTNFVYYEIRRYDKEYQIVRNIDADNDDPPTLPDGSQVDNWIPSVLWEFTYDGDVYPSWTMIRGGTNKSASRKSMTECFYTSQYRIDVEDLLQGSVGNYVGLPASQDLNIPIDSEVLLLADNVDTNRLLGLTAAGASVDANGISVAGFDFNLSADQAFGVLSGVFFNDVAFSILEPFSLQNLTIFSTGLGKSTKRSNVLALFNASQFVTKNNEIVYEADDPVFYHVDAPGRFNARKFAFQLTTFNGGSIAVAGDIFVSLLVRFPKTVSF
jgi:hypothetical protein